MKLHEVTYLHEAKMSGIKFYSKIFRKQDLRNLAEKYFVFRIKKVFFSKFVLIFI